ncbi:MAG: right-handed parallel beta-helix repeat-containing protein, partial [Candidatus Marinimicrobia bacterium]|nr:right-handed parallel beta-helix repeat-containing protein [Candidatus Neomarinimicrobiota bacterium]
YIWIKLQSKKTYLINTELSLHTGSEGVKFDGNFSTIKAGGAMTNVVSIGDTTTVRVQLRNLLVNANSVATYGIYMMLVTETNSLIQNCSVTGATSHGWYLRKCQVVRFENMKSYSNGGAGFLIDDCNCSIFDTIRSTANTDNGITIQKTDYTGGCQLSNIDIENNSEHGMEIVNTLSPVTIKGGWLEGNTKDGILIGGSARGVSVHGVGITGGDAGNVYRAIRLSSGAAGCDVIDNRFAYSAGTQFGNVVDESSSFNRIYPNYYRSNGAILGSSVPIINELITEKSVGMGGYLAGGTAISIAATGNKTFTFTPSGTFNIPGADNRGAYLVEIDFVGYFAGVDETCFKRFHIYLATNAAIDYDASITEIYSRGDTRKSALTGATPTSPGSSTFAVVFSNSDDSSFDGYFTWRVIMTTEGKLTLEVT